MRGFRKINIEHARRKDGPVTACFALLCLGLGLLISVTPAYSQAVQKVSAAIGEVQVLQVQGTVRKVGPNVAAGQPSVLTTGTLLTPGDRIRSEPASYATLGLADGSWIEVQPNTELEILDLKGGIRELLRLWIGKVRINIRKLTGAPNPYRMHTPIATIGVRGTEFEITVDRNSVTTVKVLEGEVAVKDVQTSSGEVVLQAGEQITIYPLRPPNPPITLEQVVAENLSRESSVEQPVLRKFLAFSDPHLDMVDNPAYASQFVKPGGRLYLYPARSSSFTQPEISPLSPIRQFTDVQSLFATDSRTLQGVATRASYAYPTANWAWAGLFEYRGFNQDFHYNFSRQVPTPFGNVQLNQIGQSFYAPDLNLDSNTTRTVLVGARRFPGKTVAASYDWTRSRGQMDSLFEFGPDDILLMSETSSSLFENDTRKLSFGYHLQDDSVGSVALAYKVGFISGRSYQQQHEIDGRSSPLAEFTLSGRSHETGIEWRKRIHRNVTVAGFGNLARLNFGQDTRNFRTVDSVEATTAWIPSLGLGLGFNWRERVFAALDYQGSFLAQRSNRNQAFDLQTVGIERTRRQNHALHGWLQVRLPAHFFVGGGFTSFWSRQRLEGTYKKDLNGRRTDSQGRLQMPMVSQLNQLDVRQTGLSFGKSLGKLLYLEYQVSNTMAPRFRPVNHSFLLRLSF